MKAVFFGGLAGAAALSPAMERTNLDSNVNAGAQKSQMQATYVNKVASFPMNVGFHNPLHRNRNTIRRFARDFAMKKRMAQKKNERDEKERVVQAFPKEVTTLRSSMRENFDAGVRVESDIEAGHFEDIDKDQRAKKSQQNLARFAGGKQTPIPSETTSASPIQLEMNIADMQFRVDFDVKFNFANASNNQEHIIEQVVLDTGSSYNFLFTSNVKACHSGENMDATCSSSCSGSVAAAQDMGLPEKHVPDAVFEAAKVCTAKECVFWEIADQESHPVEEESFGRFATDVAAGIKDLFGREQMFEQHFETMNIADAGGHEGDTEQMETHSLICYGSGFVAHRYQANASFRVPDIDHSDESQFCSVKFATVVNHAASWSLMSGMIGLAVDTENPDQNDHNLIMAWHANNWILEPTFIFQFSHPASFTAGWERHRFLADSRDSACVTAIDTKEMYFQYQSNFLIPGAESQNQIMPMRVISDSGSGSNFIPSNLLNVIASSIVDKFFPNTASWEEWNETLANANIPRDTDRAGFFGKTSTSIEAGVVAMNMDNGVFTISFEDAQGPGEDLSIKITTCDKLYTATRPYKKCTIRNSTFHIFKGLQYDADDLIPS